MKKILFLTNMYPSKQFPSYGIFVKKTYDWLIEEYDVTLVKICKSNNIVQKLWRYITFYSKAIAFGCFGNYDCVYAHYISHASLAIRCIKVIRKNVLVVGNIHGEDVFSEFAEFKKNRLKSEKFIEKADYIISPSEPFAERLCKEYRFEKSKVFVSPSGGIDTEFFNKIDKVEAKRVAKLDLDKSYVGFVSRMEKGKGWDVFVDALSLVIKQRENVMALIVGDGSEHALLKQYIGDKGIEKYVKLIPFAAHEELLYLYNSMDVFCFPSRREAESLGLVGLEAMACEVLCTITALNGPATYAKDGYNCLLFYPENVKELESKIISLLDEKEEVIEVLKKHARITAMQYDEKSMKESFLQFFGDILS